MRSRVKSGLLWGAVGALTFLVLVQGYALAVEPLPLGVPAAVGLALAVGGTVAAGSLIVERRAAAKGRT